MSKGRALFRILLAVCITVLLLGDVFRGLHLLHSRHVLCPVHGELVEAGEGNSSGIRPAKGAQALPSGEEGHHHDHCGLAAAPSRLAGLAVASAPPCIEATASTVTPVPLRATPVVGRAVLTYAPKQSPPAGAV